MMGCDRVKKLGKKQLRMIHKVDFDQVPLPVDVAVCLIVLCIQIKDARIGVGLRTAFGTIKERGSYGKRR